MESITSAADGIIINDCKLVVSERIGTIANLFKEIRDLFAEYWPDLCN